MLLCITNPITHHEFRNIHESKHPTDVHTPDCTVSVPYAVAESTPSSSRHWKTPSSCGVTAAMLTEEPETWKRRDIGPMGSPLNSQVTLGAGFPFATQVKRAEEPTGSSWSAGPSLIDSGSAEETEEHRKVELHTKLSVCFCFWTHPEL